MDDLRTAQHAVSFGVTASRAAATNTHWHCWSDFCTTLAVDPLLQNVADPVPILQVFLQRYRDGVVSASGQPVQGRTAEDAIRLIGQTFAAMGSPDPRLIATGALDFRLARQIQHYKKLDTPPHRVKPVPVRVLQWIMQQTHTSPHPRGPAIADMIALAFFFLLRPGEYTATPSETTPFRLADVRLSAGPSYFDLTTATDAMLDSATFVSLTFTTQKSGVRGEVVGMGRSGCPRLCPVLATIRRVKHLRHANAPTHTPLSVYVANGIHHCITPADITAKLQEAVIALGPATLGFSPDDISARCLRASGATALLCADVNPAEIRLLGRWNSDKMFRYLHLQAEPVMRDFAQLMLVGGDYVLHPNAQVPQLPNLPPV